MNSRTSKKLTLFVDHYSLFVNQNYVYIQEENKNKIKKTKTRDFEGIRQSMWSLYPHKVLTLNNSLIKKKKKYYNNEDL